MFTVTVFFVLAASITTIMSIMNKVPLWVPVLLLCVVALLQILPK